MKYLCNNFVGSSDARWFQQEILDMEDSFDIDLLLDKEWWELDLPPLGSVTYESIKYGNTFDEIDIVQVIIQYRIAMLSK